MRKESLSLSAVGHDPMPHTLPVVFLRKSQEDVWQDMYFSTNIIFLCWFSPAYNLWQAKFAPPSHVLNVVSGSILCSVEVYLTVSQDWTEKNPVQRTHIVAGYLSFIHLTVGAGSPTALQGRIISFIHGVVTVPLNVKILAGANE